MTAATPPKPRRQVNPIAAALAAYVMGHQDDMPLPPPRKAAPARSKEESERRMAAAQAKRERRRERNRRNAPA